MYRQRFHDLVLLSSGKLYRALILVEMFTKYHYKVRCEEESLSQEQLRNLYNVTSYHVSVHSTADFPPHSIILLCQCVIYTWEIPLVAVLEAQAKL